MLPSDELARWKRTEKSGKLSTTRGELQRAGQYPPIRVLVNSARIDKLLNSFGETLTALVSPVTGRIHAALPDRRRRNGARHLLRTQPAADPWRPKTHFGTLFIPAPGNVLIVADYARWRCAPLRTFLAVL